MKKMIQAPFSKAINGLNPGIKMPIELAMGRSMFPDVFHPSTIRDPAEYIARSFALQWPYKAAMGIPHNNLQELSNILLYTQNDEEAAYWQTLDKVGSSKVMFSISILTALRLLREAEFYSALNRLCVTMTEKRSDVFLGNISKRTALNKALKHP